MWHNCVVALQHGVSKAGSASAPRWLLNLLNGFHRSPETYGQALRYFLPNGRSRSVSASLRPFSRLAFIQFFTASV
jgi:hypothetical protein